MVCIESWEYHIEFLVLPSKTKFNGYPLILGRPWLATPDAYISCRVGNMTIENGPLSEELVLYHPSQPSIGHDMSLWLEDEEEYKVYHAIPYPIYTLDIFIRGGKPDEYDLIDHILQIQPPTSIPIDDLVR